MSGNRKFDDLWEAVTFAEAGETEAARRIASEVFPEARQRGERILAVSGAPGFSQRMIENSVSMAERLDYGLIALSLPSAMARLVANLGVRPGQGGWLPPEVFRARAVEHGIPFVHAVRRGDPEMAVAAARRKFRRIAFLLIDPDLAPKGRFTGVNIPIFYLADP